MSSVFVAEWLGLFILVVSAVFLLRRERFMEYAREFAENTSLRYTVAFIELSIGLAVVLSHSCWNLSYRGVITVIGWMMVIEAVFHMLASEEHEQRVIDMIGDDRFLEVFGVVGVFLGLYLATKGFTCF